VKDAGRRVPCQDLLDDPIVAWNARLHPWLDQIVCFVVPGVYGVWRCGSFVDGVLIFGALRWVVELHATWCVNSVAHTFGSRPYRPDIRPCESLVTSLVANGEGWHNWHHAFPFDYATSEFGVLWQWNPTKVLIDLLAAMGQVHARKRHEHVERTPHERVRTASVESDEMVEMARTTPPVPPGACDKTDLKPSAHVVNGPDGGAAAGPESDTECAR
jgi:fatty-acid desaturase